MTDLASERPVQRSSAALRGPAIANRLVRFGARSVLATLEVGALVVTRFVTGGGPARKGD